MKQIIKIIVRKFVPEKLRKLVFRFGLFSGIEKKRQELLYFEILQYFDHNSIEEFRKEVEFLKKKGSLAIFPYNHTKKEPDNLKSGFDEIRKMPFVFHKDKKLYYPSNFSTEQARRVYLNLVFEQNILEEKYSEKTPHQYITDSFYVQNDDIVLDIGATEGLFMLNVIDKVRRGFILEPDKTWTKALMATFEPYKERVTIINKYASNEDSKKAITVDSCLKDEFGNIFIKMDVEGSESLVLNGAKNMLNRNNDIRVACCTYHRHEDANLFVDFFKSINYQIEFSDGYMLLYFDDTIKPPYFRRGLIRAKK
jgi:hypothetical protein